MIKEDMKYINSKCICCGEYVMQDLYDICPICGWENDPIQNEDPIFVGGANRDSLLEHKAKFLELRKKKIKYKWIDTKNI